MASNRLIDVPVQNRLQESLGIGMYADILSRFIMSCETPITIGIQGDWGIGKTSMLNLVREQLAPTKGRTVKYHTIYFNTWQYSQFHQEEFLGLSILKGIMNEIQCLESLRHLKSTESFQNSLKGFGRFVTALGNQVVKKQSGLDIQAALSKEDEESILDNDIVVLLRQMKAEFGNLVKGLIQNDRDRLVIMIDDLDRIKPVRALEFLEAIKNFLDVESCVFVIAVDYSVIQAGMTEKLGRTAQQLQGKSYFDKIIQIPFSMPAASYRTDKYVMSLLGWDCDKAGKYSQIETDRDRFFLAVRAKNISKSVVEFFTNITGLAVGTNPRSIKRSVNYANLLRMVVVAQRAGSNKEWTMWDAQLLYPLACMQLAWPELFEHFSNEPNPATLAQMQDFDYLQQLRGMDALFRRSHNPDETMSNITGFIDEFIALIDEDENGQISNKEFKPIWQMMVDANMTSAKYRNAEEDWRRLEEKVLTHMRSDADRSSFMKIENLFRNDDSAWSSMRDFDLLGAGKKFFNILWRGKQVGSIATTQAEPIQIYLKGDYERYESLIDESVKEYLIDVSSMGHYGTGDIQVDMDSLVESADAQKIFNRIHAAMVSCLKLA